nr:MAG TPA: hypothetical protein [Caudoviricetes sp.]
MCCRHILINYYNANISQICDIRKCFVNYFICYLAYL